MVTRRKSATSAVGTSADHTSRTHPSDQTSGFDEQKIIANGDDGDDEMGVRLEVVRRDKGRTRGIEAVSKPGPMLSYKIR